MYELTLQRLKTYKLGDPTKEDTNLGPVVNIGSAEKIRKQIKDAVKAGAKALIPEELFPAAKEWVWLPRRLDDIC